MTQPIGYYRKFSLAKAEREQCRRWLVKILSCQGPIGFAKSEFRLLARSRFGTPDDLFDDAWALAVADTGRSNEAHEF
jgi:hypothetical protein